MKRLGMKVMVIVGCLMISTLVMAKVNLNTASSTELQSLPRIGPSLAQAIIEYREVNGTFKSIREIMNVPRIGEKTFAELKDFITVDARNAITKESKPKPNESTIDTIKYEPIVKMTSTPVPTPTPTPSIREIMSNFAGEPTIQDVQAEAIKYAQIHPERFSQWRRAVKNRALIPDRIEFKVRNDTDDDTDYSRSKMISLTGGAVTIGPDDETWEHDTDDDWSYEFKMRWNFQDYFFNNDMLKVSSETEDQVELRQEILEDVTKLYFDRRRLQVEMLLNEGSSIHTIMKEMLKLEELTAAIDGLTGGYFAKEIGKQTANQ